MGGWYSSGVGHGGKLVVVVKTPKNKSFDIKRGGGGILVVNFGVVFIFQVHFFIQFDLIFKIVNRFMIVSYSWGIHHFDYQSLYYNTGNIMYNV